MSSLISRLSNAQKQLVEKIKDGDPQAHKSLETLRNDFAANREALLAAGQADPEVQQFAEVIEKTLLVAEAEIEENKTPEHQAIRSCKLSINHSIRTVVDYINRENSSSALTQLNHAMKVIANNRPQLDKSDVGRQYLASAEARIAELQAQIAAIQKIDPVLPLVKDLTGPKSRLEGHLSNANVSGATTALQDLETKLQALTPVLQQSEPGQLYLQRASKVVADYRARVNNIALFANAEQLLKSATSGIRFTRTHLKSGGLSAAMRQSNVSNSWRQTLAAAGPLQAPELQAFPEVAQFWADFESTQGAVKECLGESTYNALLSGDAPTKPKSKSTMKNLLNAVNSAVTESGMTKAVSSSLKTLNLSGGSASTIPKAASASKLPPQPSTTSTNPPVTNSLSYSPIPNPYSAPAPPLPQRASSPALISHPTSIALVDFNGTKSKLTVRSDSIAFLSSDIEKQLGSGSLVIEFEDSDFPGHFLPLSQLGSPIPSKLILKARAAHAHSQSASPLPSSSSSSSPSIPERAPSASLLSVGQLDFRIPISELEFGQRIGSGSFGQVFKGYWRGQPVAIKENIVTNPAAREEFLAEAKLMINLRPHRHIVQVLGLAESEDGKFYLVMDLMKTSLEKISTDPDMRAMMKTSTSMVREYALGIASGMTHLEAERLVHRDLACRNVLVDEAGVVKISDFGLSRRVDGGPEAAGATQSNIGPIRWMAPENFHRVYSSKSDVWSFACTIVELLTGSPPHMELDLLSCALKIRDQGLAPEVPPGTDPVLSDILRRCWSVDPAERPTFAQIAAVLRGS